jgi:hypothetical protein
MSTWSGLTPTLCPESASVSQANSMIEPRAAARIAASTSWVLPSTRRRSPLVRVISVIDTVTERWTTAQSGCQLDRRTRLVGLASSPEVQDHLDEVQGWYSNAPSI